MHRRFHRGRIEYQRKTGGGQEWFSITVAANGDRTFRTQTEMEDIGLLRDVVQTVDANWLPRDAYVRLCQKGQFTGVAWFKFDATGVDCEAYTVGQGRVSQRVETGVPIRILASHPVLADAWQCASFDHRRPERSQTIAPWAHTSPRSDGSSGPMIGLGKKVMDYVGEERVTVPAGTFDTRRYRIHYTIETTLAPMETWVHGEDTILIQMASPFGKYILTDYASG